MFEDRDLAFHQRLREGFRAIAKAEPGRCVLLDAARPANDIAAAIWATVTQRLGPL